jgi:5-formyltetrahydrofolate cyclo-ligase
MREFCTASSKAELRRTLKPRGSLDQASLLKASHTLWERAIGLGALKKASQIGLYAPLPGEPRPQKAFEWVFAEQRQPFLPKVFNETLVYLALDPLAKLTTGRYGMPEPIGGKALDPRPGDVLFVPGLAFDLRGYRLGRGKGHFDRFLATLPPFVIKIGVCFEASLCLSLPVDAWDQPVDIVVTEEQALLCTAYRHQLQPKGV